MYCISISYKKAPADIRQKYAFSKEELPDFLRRLIDACQLDGAVLVSTCNRTELFYASAQIADDEIVRFITKYKPDANEEETKKYGMFFHGKHAIRHLYRVVSGLDSMVLGEDEIFHQVKDAFQLSDEAGLLCGELNVIFQGAFQCAKAARSNTSIKETPVSIGTLTANVIENYLATDTERKSVLLIGATGQIGSIVAKDLIDKGIPVIGTTRLRRSKSIRYYENHDKMSWRDFSERYDILEDVSVVVSATTSPHYTILKDEFLSAKSDGDYLLIDLAVPYDIDHDLAQESGIAFYDIDHFKELSRQNTEKKQSLAEDMELIVEDAVEDLEKKLIVQDFHKNHAKEFQQDWFQKMMRYLRDGLTADELERVLSNISEHELDAQEL